MADDDALARAGAVARSGRCASIDVEQLADRHRRRARRVGALVVAGVGDDQPLGRGQQRVEQQLAVLAARVAVADVRVARAAGRRRRAAPCAGTRRRRGRAGRRPGGAPSASGRACRRSGGRCGSSRASAGREPVGAAAPAPRPARARRAGASPGLGDDRRRARRCSSRALPARRGRWWRSSASAASRDRRGPVGERLRRAQRVAAPSPRRVDQLGEAAGEVDRAAVDVVERQHAAEQALAVLGHRHPEQHPVEARLPGAGCRAPSSLYGARWAASRPQRMPGLRRPVLQPGEVVVVEAEAPAHGLAVGEVEHLRGGEALLGELEQLRDDAEHGVGLAQRAVGEPDPQVDGERRRRRSSRRRSAASPAPNVAWISGANVSMSGHMTITSRGSSVGSSASRCRIASRSTSTWRARPWQAWTSTLRSSGASSGRSSAAPGSGAPGRARSSRTSLLDPAEQRVGRGERRARGGCRRRRRRPRSAPAASRARPGPRRRAAGWRPAPRSGRRRGGRRLGAAAARSRHRRPTAPATGGAGTGGRRGRPRARAGSAGSRPAAGSGRTAPAARAARAAPDRRRAARRRGPCARPGSGRRSAARSRRHSSACQADAAGSCAPEASSLAARPGAQHRRAVQRVVVKQVGEVADVVRRRLCRAAHRVRGRRSSAPEIGAPAWPARARRSDSSTTSSSGHTERSGSHGSWPGRSRRRPPPRR